MEILNPTENGGFTNILMVSEFFWINLLDPLMADSSFSFNIMIHMVTIKLSSTNYLFWRNQLFPFLQCQNLLSHVDGSVAAPPITIVSDSSSSQPNPKYVE